MNASITEIIRFLYTGGYEKAIKLCLEGNQASVFTPNSEMIYKANKDDSLWSLLRSADILFPDGMGSYLGMKLLHIPVKCRTTGIDLAENILSECARRGYRVFLLGGKERVAEKAAKNLTKKYAGLNICGYHHGYFDDDQNVVEKISLSKPDVLFVCLGFPKQEEWINKNLKRLTSVRLAMGLGGSLDVWSGKVRRAPHFVSSVGLEWLWRMCNDPKRVKRVCFLFDFSILVLKEVLIKSKKLGNCYEIDNFSK